jgi:hypothetical protein
MCSTWLSIHSPQYSSRRRAATDASTVTPQASSMAAHALIWYATGQIPQIRAVMSGGSVCRRPRRKASKNRGGS